MRFVMVDLISETRHILPIEDGPIDDVDEIFEDLLLGKFMSGLEINHGVHDVSFSPATDMWGFSSYEIEDWPAILEIWKSKLKELGFSVGTWTQEPS
jgi:hypothetical protein